MAWQHDKDAAAAARRLFARTTFDPEVRSNGAGVYVNRDALHAAVSDDEGILREVPRSCIGLR